MSLAIIGGLLGHKSTATAKRYAHLMDRPLRSAAAIVSDRLAAALQGTHERRPGETVSDAVNNAVAVRSSPMQLESELERS